MSRACPSIGSNVGGTPELLNKELIFKKESVIQICNLLKKMNKTLMLEEANRSFIKSQCYDEKELNKRRHKFYSDFAESI